MQETLMINYSNLKDNKVLINSTQSGNKIVLQSGELSV